MRREPLQDGEDGAPSERASDRSNAHAVFTVSHRIWTKRDRTHDTGADQQHNEADGYVYAVSDSSDPPPEKQQQRHLHYKAHGCPNLIK